jgi:hypothetical protein
MNEQQERQRQRKRNFCFSLSTDNGYIGIKNMHYYTEALLLIAKKGDEWHTHYHLLKHSTVNMLRLTRLQSGWRGDGSPEGICPTTWMEKRWLREKAFEQTVPIITRMSSMGKGILTRNLSWMNWFTQTLNMRRMTQQDEEMKIEARLTFSKLSKTSTYE